MESEMEEHLGYEKSARSESDGSRNGYMSKRITTSYGGMEIEVPQDRRSTLEPKVVKKRQKDNPEIVRNADRRIVRFERHVQTGIVVTLAYSGDNDDFKGNVIVHLYGTDLCEDLPERCLRKCEPLDRRVQIHCRTVIQTDNSGDQEPAFRIKLRLYGESDIRSNSRSSI